MARKADIPTDLTLEIDGPNVTPERFLKAVRSFFAVVSEVATGVCGKKAGVRWTVSVKQGSNLICLNPVPGVSQAAINQVALSVQQGFGQLEEASVRPQFFSDKAIRNARELAEVGDDDTTVRLWIKKTPRNVTKSIEANVAKLLISEHADYGSIEGRLQTVTERGGFHFVVYQMLWDEPIRCNVPPRLSDLALRNFGQRVEVYGTIKYRKDGQPVSIEADDIVPFPPSEQIPNFRDVHGILREAS